MRKNPAKRIMVLVLAGGLVVASAGWGLLSPVKAVLAWTTTPVARIFASAGADTGGWFNTITSIKDLAAENARLEEEVRRLRAGLAEAGELRSQNEILRKQIGFSDSGTQKLVPAQVIGYQPDNFRQYLTIDQGSADGIREGQAVVSEGFLVGRVTEVTPASAKVFMVTDPNFRVNAIAQNSRASGTIRGQIGSGLVMDKIAQSDAIEPDDIVITSGLGGELPKGLVIGRVQSVQRQDNAVFQTAQVVSDLRFSRLELVFVVVNS